jgi:dGTPase
MHKTQVFWRLRGTISGPVDPYHRGVPDRQNHSGGLALNEDLAEAIAMGHDLGHTPFGHNGEVFSINGIPVDSSTVCKVSE